MRRTAIVAVLAATLLTAAATPARAASTIDYVALGDSYAAGLGAPGGTGWCARGPQSYPRRWVAAHPVRSFAFVACSGATTVEVRRDQLPALGPGTDLISVQVGGNDAGFAPAVTNCLVVGDGACRAGVEVAKTFIRYVLPGRLDATYAEIRRRSPAAKVVVLGYPRLFATGSCPGGMSAAKRTALNEGADALAVVVAARAAAAGFTWVDVREAFAGHGVCGPAPWINAASVLRPADSFHPNAAGYGQGYLPAFTAAV
jgi:lysophospholipase L1-like esterase